MKNTNPYHKKPQSWLVITSTITGQFLRYEHVDPCNGAIIIGTGGQFREAHCANCTCTWTRPNARNTWRREE